MNGCAVGSRRFAQSEPTGVLGWLIAFLTVLSGHAPADDARVASAVPPVSGRASGHSTRRRPSCRTDEKCLPWMDRAG